MLGVVLLAAASTGCAVPVRGSARPAPDAPAEVCHLLPAADVQNAFGLNGLTAGTKGPIYDHGTPAYLCVYTDTDGASDAALETAVFPAGTLTPRQLVENFASAGQLESGDPDLGDAAAFVSDLAGNPNTGVVAVRRIPAGLRLVAIIIASSVAPAKDTMVTVVRTVLGKLP